MPIDAGFWTKLAVKHGVTEEQARVIAGNEGLLGELNEMALRRDDAKQVTEQAQAVRAKADAEMAKAQAAWEQNTVWYGQKQADLILLDKYKEIHGELEGGGGNGNGRQQNIASPMTVEEIDKRVRGAQREVYSLTSQILDAADDYRDKFGKSLPRKELESIALKPENQGREFREIYREYVEPKVREKTDAEIEARIKVAREEGEKAGLAKGRMREPTQGSPDDVSPLFMPRQKDTEVLDEETRMRNFRETFDKTMAADPSRLAS